MRTRVFEKRKRRTTTSELTMRIAICVYFLDLGGTTRAIEIARSMRKTVAAQQKDRQQRRERSNNKEGDDVEICFFGNKGPGHMSYEYLVRSAGFNVVHFEPEIDSDMWVAFLHSERTGQGFYPPPYESKAATHIKGVMDGLGKYEPTIVVHGLFPEVSIATKLLNVHSIAFGPLPPDVEWMDKYLFRSTERNIQPEEEESNNAFSSQQQPSPLASLYKAAVICGWNPDIHGLEFHMVPRADVCLVCDLESNYPDRFRFGKHMYVVGPIFARTYTSSTDVTATASLMDNIRRLFGINKKVSIDNSPTVVLSSAALNLLEEEDKTKVFLCMKSSVESSIFLEAVKALSETPYNVVIAMPHNISCTQDHVEEILRKNNKEDGSFIVMTEFVSCDKILPFIDVMITNGGQGSVQCALAHGCPIIGVPMHKEHRWNLDNVERRNAGIQLSTSEWTAATIKESLDKVIKSTRYAKAAHQIKDEMSKVNGSDNAAELILSFAVAQELIKKKIGFYQDMSKEQGGV